MTETNFDQWVGRNVQELRKAVGLTQGDLAQLLSDRGLGFHQQTVAKLESGQRAIKLQEAAVIASVLECDLNLLIDERVQNTAAARVLTGIRLTEASRDALRAAVQRHESYRTDLRRVIEYRRDEVDVELLERAETTLSVDSLEVTREELEKDASLSLREDQERSTREFAQARAADMARKGRKA